MRISLVCRELIEILTHKIKFFHETSKTIKMEEAIEERRRVCIQLGILSARNQHLVTNLSDPLPWEPPFLGEKDEGADSSEYEGNHIGYESCLSFCFVLFNRIIGIYHF